jgi:hypothetical protein
MKTAIRIVATANFNAGTKLTDILGYANIQSADRGTYEVITYPYFNNYVAYDAAITIAHSLVIPSTVVINSKVKVSLTIASTFKFVNYVSVIFPTNFVPSALCYPDTTTDIAITSMAYTTLTR